MVEKCSRVKVASSPLPPKKLSNNIKATGIMKKRLYIPMCGKIGKSFEIFVNSPKNINLCNYLNNLYVLIVRGCYFLKKKDVTGYKNPVMLQIMYLCVRPILP